MNIVFACSINKLASASNEDSISRVILACNHITITASTTTNITTTTTANSACQHGGHYCDYYLYALHSYQVTATRLKLSTRRFDDQHHYELQEPDFLIRPAVNITVNKFDIQRFRYHCSCGRVTIVWSLWRHQQSIVTSSAERKQSEWETGMMHKDRRFYRHLWIRYVV